MTGRFLSRRQPLNAMSIDGMLHIDEHTLELFVLDPGGLRGEEAEIRSHLAECHGCRSLADRMRSLYERAESELATQPDPAARRSGGLAKRRRETKSLYEPIRTPAVRSVNARLWGLRQFVIRHPAIAGTTTLSFLALVIAGATMTVNGLKKDSNPAYCHLNPEQELLEVFNVRNEKLWSYPGVELGSVEQMEQESRISLTQVVDLDGDGLNEIVTGVPLRSGGSKNEGVVHVLDPKGRILRELGVGAPIEFLGTRYASAFSPRMILTRNASEGTGKEIIVGSSSVRSPFLISRFSSDGRTLGEYWHFGALYGLYSVDIGGEGKEEIVACGTNDMVDTTGESGSSPAVIVVLQPDLLSGKKESSQTRGFGLQPSGAEMRYIYLPRSDLQDVLGVSAGVKSMTRQLDSTYSFFVCSGRPDEHPVFYFSFSRDLAPLAVVSDDNTERLHHSLRLESKVSSHWGAEYMRELLSRVRSIDLSNSRPNMVPQ
jgi:hypothetical protein